MRYGVRLTIIAAALSVWGTGCIATRQWSREFVSKRQAEMDDRFVKVENGVREHGERLDKVEFRVADLETRTVRQGTSPEKTNTEKTNTVVARSTARRTLVSVVLVPFAFDRADLGMGADVALATIVTELRDNPHMTLDLEGTTDTVGSVDYNVRLSQRRVEAVKRRLIEQGIDPVRIVSSTARGPLLDSGVKDNLKRRVMVKLMKLTD